MKLAGMNIKTKKNMVCKMLNLVQNKNRTYATTPKTPINITFIKNAKELLGKLFTLDSDLTNTTNNKRVKNKIMKLKIVPTTKFFSLFTSGWKVGSYQIFFSFYFRLESGFHFWL